MADTIPHLFDLYAQTTLEEYFLQFSGQNYLPNLTHLNLTHLNLTAVDTPREIKVGILGAGVAGLYAAVILDSLKDPYITYEILEGQEKRVGGRLFTYHFSDSEYDYYDVGAMRFPKIPFMEPVFKLIEKLGLNDRLLEYVKSCDKNVNFFNNITLTNAEIEKANDDGDFDPFHTKIHPKDTVDAMISAQVGVFKRKIQANHEEGWNYLMQYDHWSTRTFMRLKGAEGTGTYSEEIINYLETFGSATTLFDRALSETVMESLIFDYKPNMPWHCLRGGADHIATAMVDRLPKNAIVMGHRVTRIATIKPAVYSETILPSYAVTCSTPDMPANNRTYDHVISTLPLSTLRFVDTQALHLPWKLQTAMRSLQYDASVKVAIKFSRRWWEDQSGGEIKYGGQLGGESHTDRPTRVAVYPSYGIGGNDATMIVSYTWAQDALRNGTLVHRDGKEAAEGPSKSPGNKEEVLVDLILQDLAAMHGMEYAKLKSLVEAHHAWDWYGNEFSAGAFALFGPSQFKELYPQVTQPLNGSFHFAGEATSVYHAWVIGALNSAYRSVREILCAEGRKDLLEIMEKEWGMVDEIKPEYVETQVKLAERINELSYHDTRA